MANNDCPQRSNLSKCSLHRGPPELLYEIIRCAEARDAVSLCSTCRAFRSLLSERTVWILILRSVCYEDGIYFPSYDISSMSIDELQRAVMGQYRLTQLLQQNCVSEETQNSPDGLPTLKPASGPTRLDMLEKLSPDNEEPSGGGRNFVLIPGGRYLVMYEFPFVRLFDLGPAGQLPMSTPVQIASIASREREPFWLGVYLLAWEHDSGWLRVAVGIMAQNELSLSVSVYAVLPTAPAPKFEVLGSVMFTSPRLSTWTMQVHQSRIYISNREGGNVWDFETGRYVPTPAYHGERLEDEVFVGDYVVNFGWELLAVSPVGSEEIDVPPSGQIGLPIVIAGPRPHEFQYPFQDQNESHIVRPPTLRPHMSFPMIFDAASSPGKDRPFHAIVDLIESPGNPRSFDIMFSSKTTYSFPLCLNEFQSLPDPSASIRLRSSSRTLALVDDPVLPSDSHVCVISLPHGQADAKDMLTILRLGTDSGALTGPCTLCSASGRFVYMFWQSTGVVIVDYLSSSLI